jgi:phosphomethylpyrimidine synthase
MKITQNVRDYAQNQKNASVAETVDSEVESGLQAMKNAYHEHGQKLYHKV